jgi:3-phosphoshikimate 1-carboxyvinyltransferase
VALSKYEDTEIELLGLKENSLQGDSAIVEIMRQLGVQSTFTENGVLLTKITSKESLTWDFANCPDLTQTVAVVCAAKNIPGHFTGIESLKIKETDRVLALQNELKKIGGDLVEVEKNHLYEVKCNASIEKMNTVPFFDTYDDHRMAMAFAPLAMLIDVEIEEREVVVKSYPEYWEHLSEVIKDY